MSMMPRGVCAISGFVLAAVMACVSSSQAPTPLVDRRECPREWDTLRFGVSVLNRNTPEFHDCQRFITVDDNDERSYLPYFAILASDNLVRAFNLVQSFPDPAFGRPVADVFAQVPYDALGIESGTNCLVMFIDDDVLKAKMIPVPAGSDSPCDGTKPVSVGRFSGKTLVVHRIAQEGLRAGDYPPVTRWDWDETNGNQYIGIACGTSWCEIGDQSLTLDDLSTAHEAAALRPGAPSVGWIATTTQRRVREVKGWYDEQYLAYDDGTGEPVPTRLMATLFPSAELDWLLDAPGDALLPGIGPFDKDWREVARVRVRNRGSRPEHLRLYADKFNFVPHRTAETSISLCHGTQFECLGSNSYGDSPACHEDPRYPEAIVGMWWARYRFPGRTDVFRCTKFYPVSHGIAVRGNVRWRWTLDDEGSWEACPSGCCESL